jgi:DNA-directed RNA polymerase specialized sigma24 family protein
MKKSVCEEENFNTLYRDFSKQLRNFLYYKVGDIDRAEDMVQDAMVKLWENCAEIAFEKAKSFLYTVCNNLLIK